MRVVKPSPTMVVALLALVTGGVRGGGVLDVADPLDVQGLEKGHRHAESGVDRRGPAPRLGVVGHPLGEAQDLRVLGGDEGGRLAVVDVELRDAATGALNAKLRVSCEVTPPPVAISSTNE